jgi:hypothetical protein
MSEPHATSSAAEHSETVNFLSASFTKIQRVKEFKLVMSDKTLMQ